MALLQYGKEKYFVEGKEQAMEMAEPEKEKRESSGIVWDELEFGRESLLVEGKGLLFGLAIGILVGVVGGAFVAALNAVTQFRTTYPWMLYCLPLGGFFIVWLYHRAGKKALGGTNLVIVGARGGGGVPRRLAPLIFVSTIVTHLFGGSAGREGAALQMGGSLATWLGKRLKLEGKLMEVIVLCGMSAGFSAVFGGTISSVVFALEISCVGMLPLHALFPCVVSSITAGTISAAMGAEPVRFYFPAQTTSLLLYAKILVLALLCAWLSIFVCHVLQRTERWLTRILSNDYIRVAVGACTVIGLSTLLQSQAYLGSGEVLMEKAVVFGDASPFSFLLKLIFTAVTLAAGFRGGEIVPVFSIGAVFGCVVSPFLGLSSHLGAAVGMIALFCSVTNCPMASLCLAFEVFRFNTPVGFLVAVAVSFLASGYSSLYSKQLFAFSKTEPGANVDIDVEIKPENEEKG